MKRWKATDYPQFLLNVSPVVMKNILIGDYKPLLDNFLSLSTDIYILLSPKLSISENVEYPDSLIHFFIENTKILYGEESKTFMGCVI